jgi:DNA-binding transcriptional ArsR family regulator
MPNYVAMNLDHVFQALSDPTRRAILHRLSRGAASVSELAKPFAMAMPSLLQHLRVLEDSHLIRSHKAGRVRICEMQGLALSVAEGWLAEQRAVWEGRLHRMEAYVATLQSREKKRGKRHTK